LTDWGCSGKWGHGPVGHHPLGKWGIYPLGGATTYVLCSAIKSCILKQKFRTKYAKKGLYFIKKNM